MRIEDVDKKIPYTSGLVKKIDQNTKTTDFENRIPSVAGLVTIGLSNIKPTKTEKRKIVLNTKDAEIQRKIHDITNLATKAALNTKSKDIENEILDTTSFNTIDEIAQMTFDVRIKEAAKRPAINVK